MISKYKKKSLNGKDFSNEEKYLTYKPHSCTIQKVMATTMSISEMKLKKSRHFKTETSFWINQCLTNINL